MSIKVTCSALLLAVLAVSCMLQTASAGYNFGYGVSDPSTGDFKDQHEAKNGDQLTGYYRLLDADGQVRTVNYQSHPLTGFTAQVHKDPIGMEGQSEYRSAQNAAPPRTLWPAGARSALLPNTAYLPLEGYQPL